MRRSWNHETEVEKVKKRTNILFPRPGFLIGCPEPEDESIIRKTPSIMSGNTSTSRRQSPQQVDSKIYHKQINKKFFKSPTKFSNYQIQQGQMNPMELNVVQSPTTLPLWQAAFVRQPIFVTPSFDQPQPMAKKTEMPRNHFKKHSDILQRQPTETSVSHGYKPFHKKKYNKNKNNIDLRLLLSLKRRENIVNEKEEQLRIKTAAISLNDERSDTEYDSSNAVPSCSSRRSFDGKIEDDGESNWLEPKPNKNLNKNLKPVYSRRYSFHTDTELENYDEENNYYNNKQLDHSNQKDCGTNPKSVLNRRRSFHTEIQVDDEDDEENDWSSYKNLDTEKKPMYNRRRSYSFSEKFYEDDNKTQQSFDLPQSSSARCSNVNTDEETDNEVNEDFNAVNSQSQIDLKSQGDNNSLEKEVLRSILQICEDVEIWYIVTDSYVLTNNTHFLTNILNADEKCRLIIPQTVINKIHSAARSFALASKALYFVCQQVEANTAIIDDGAGIVETKEDIMNCSYQLLKKGNQVIILTGDIELYAINTLKIPMFTVTEIKQLVKETNLMRTQVDNLDAVLPEIGHYTITIPNKINSLADVGTESPNVTQPLISINPDTAIERDKRQRLACDIGIQANCVTSPKVTEDINKEVILPDSSKTDYICKRPVIRNKRKVWPKRKRTTTYSLTDGNGIDDVVPNSLTDSTTNDSSLSSVDNSIWQSYPITAAYLNKDKRSETGELSYPSFAGSVKNESQIVKETAEDDKHVMFEITDERMEEVLTVYSEVWVSRLMQVMEKALGQVLHVEAACAEIRKHWPPPWSLMVAAECVKQCFLHDVDVVEAATKFVKSFSDSETLGTHGSASIMRQSPEKLKMSPHNFMELYSYAVYFIDSLQGVLMENEDIQTASKSLSKLLSDIQDPSFDISNQETIVEVTVREAIVTEDKDTSVEKDKPDDTNIVKGSPRRRPKKNKTPSTSPGKYNLRSQSKKSIEMNQVDTDTPEIRDVTKSSFLTNLYLMKNSSTPKADDDICEKTNSFLETKASSDIQENSSPNVRMSDRWLASYSDVSTADDRLENEAMLHDRLKDKSKPIANYAEYSNKDIYGSIYADVDNIAEELYNDNYVTNFVEFNNMMYDFDNNIPKDNMNTSLNSDNIAFESDIVTFKEVMESLKSAIIGAYASIEDFCVKSCESLLTAKLSESDLSRMQMRAESSSSQIQQICDVLNSILTREKTNKNIFEILRRKEFEDIACENSDKEDYSNFIADCLEEGTSLMESVTLVLEAIKEYI
ncbi:uncharacterized protein LOC112043634 [Bicyclus anynana]|uniref:Uncharacterized protein LOC112043634 n=1 Tax=Bicyclus anynana TaxID=110368 RepID=A0A6J1MWM6_BICAN|nr:uncharacterized protein LOC112043634 [Bicyclus anynana]